MKSQRLRQITVTLVLMLMVSGYLTTSALGTFHEGYYAETPCGTDVLCWISDDPEGDDFTAQEKADILAYMAATYPEATVLHPASRLYNCHGYAWIPSTSKWLNDPAPYIDSYDDEEGGDRLTYAHCVTNGPTHSAYDEGNYEAISKWGQLPVSYHDWDYVPSSYGDVVAAYVRTDCSECGPNSDCSY
jgi:hypothetical protein